MSSVQTSSGSVTQWARPGDINAGFAFLLDCVVNLFVLSGLLMAFDFPTTIILSHIIPGALVGIVVGNILNVRMAKKIARETNNPDLTAMPLGLDMPTTFGFTLAVLIPVFTMLKNDPDIGGVEEAAKLAWYVGMGGTIWMGIIKFGLSFFSQTLRRIVPLSALLGSMVGIAIVWLGAEAILGVFSIPEVGLISLAVMVYALIAGHKLPGAMPGAVVAILLGTIVFYLFGELDLINGYARPAVSGLGFIMPMPSMGGVEALFGRSLNYMAIIVPFALLIAASTVNVCAGANVLGDKLKPDQLMRADAAATIIGALFGSVVQTTPYFGHATYKRMGARTAYVQGVIAVLAIGGIFGIISFLINVLPGAAIRPVLIVVACDIVRVTFMGVKAEFAPAVSFAMIPAILNYSHTKVSELFGHVGAGLGKMQAAASSSVEAAQIVAVEAQAFLPDAWLHSYALLGAMSRGYILTGLLWAAVVAYVISGKHRYASATLMLSAVLALFGVIHSVLPTSSIYLPWAIETSDPYLATLPYHLAAGYALASLTIMAFHLFGGVEESGQDSAEDNDEGQGAEA